MNSQPTRIVIDWGSSSFRAFLLDADGNELSRVETGDGIFTLSEARSFSDVLHSTCGNWYNEHGILPTIMSGMVGSRNGWVETRYVSCPTSIDALAHNLVAVPEHENNILNIVPGVSGPNLFGEMDVMRGEEVQAFGAIRHLGISNAFVCLPGTHSKWCKVEDGKIISLTTFMTGEMFALIKAHSSIGPLIADDEYDEASFKAGLEMGRSNAGLLNTLFGIRANSLLATFDHESASSYLSGLCIGQEIEAVGQMAKAANVIIVGNTILNLRYQLALAEVGTRAEAVSGDTAFLCGISQL